ncbi:MAG: MFS transporter [Sulfobacillus sp.]
MIRWKIRWGSLSSGSSRKEGKDTWVRTRVCAGTWESLRELLRRFGWQLFGCAMSWLLLDLAFYSQNLFQPDVFATSGLIPPAFTMDGIEELFVISRAQIIVALVSTVPGYWFTVFTVDRLGRLPIQYGGFILMTLFMGLLSGLYATLKGSQPLGFAALYALTFFFANWGPNSTTFVLPSELFARPVKMEAFLRDLLKTSEDLFQGGDESWGAAGFAHRLLHQELTRVPVVGFFAGSYAGQSMARDLFDKMNKVFEPRIPAAVAVIERVFPLVFAILSVNRYCQVGLSRLPPLP